MFASVFTFYLALLVGGISVLSFLCSYFSGTFSSALGNRGSLRLHQFSFSEFLVLCVVVIQNLRLFVYDLMFEHR